MPNYKKLEDLYIDIKEATLDTLEKNKNKYELPITQAIAYYINEMEGVFEENEFEKVVTLIPIGLFIVENKDLDSKFINDIKGSISIIKSNKYDNLLNNNDKKQILEDIKNIEQYI